MGFWNGKVDGPLDKMFDCDSADKSATKFE